MVDNLGFISRYWSRSGTRTIVGTHETMVTLWRSKHTGNFLLSLSLFYFPSLSSQVVRWEKWCCFNSFHLVVTELVNASRLKRQFLPYNNYLCIITTRESVTQWLFFLCVQVKVRHDRAVGPSGTDHLTWLAPQKNTSRDFSSVSSSNNITYECDDHVPLYYYVMLWQAKDIVYFSLLLLIYDYFPLLPNKTKQKSRVNTSTHMLTLDFIPKPPFGTP